MRNLKNKIQTGVKTIIAISLFAFLSCKKKTTDTPPPVPTGVVGIHLHTDINVTEVDSGKVATDANGRKFQLNTAQFYAYNFILKKTDGSAVTISNGNYILKTIGTEMYVLGTVPAGNYSSISFNVGVDPAYNASNPSTFPSSSPLYTQNPPMWFGSTAQGYMFANIQGLADTSVSQTSTVSQYQSFSYQLGTNAMLKTISLPAMSMPLSVTANTTSGNPALFHVICDYGKLLQGVNFKTQNAATPFGNTAVATQIANNLPGMFHYEM
ncbi:MAG TPA: MbnP family protein [Bacteroidia bacterium]|jgi:hypothetical protein|nr:MbnP family protein [Bacteroidia bacterium]